MASEAQNVTVPMPEIPAVNEMPPCAACNEKLGTLVCPKCRLVPYCSEECQTSHFETHKPLCKEEKLETKEDYLKMVKRNFEDTFKALLPEDVTWETILSSVEDQTDPKQLQRAIVSLLQANGR